jgi:putative ABC transport system permease protein
MSRMCLWRLVAKEIAYRKLDFGLGVLAVVAAVACLVAVMTLLRAHADRMTEISAAKEEDTSASMLKMEDDYRVITKGLGYNILILHKDQDLGEFFSQGYASQHMPEQFVRRLAESEIVTIQHLLPALYEKIRWPEQGARTVILIGVRGEVPHLRSNRKEPMLNPVAAGTMRIGYVLSQTLGLQPGATVRLLGKDFSVAETCPQQGNTDDIALWIPLDEAQRLLGRPAEINAIMALSCVCAEGNVQRIRDEVGRLLPETQVVELAPQAAVRYQGRTRAATLSRETTDADAAHHARLRQEREALAAWLVPLVVVGSIIWIGLLAFGNVRERKIEIGVWRALGFRTKQILGVFLTKALLLGFVGAVVGYAVGFVTGLGWSVWDGVSFSLARMAALFDPALLAFVLLLAPFLAGLASWIPAVLAAQQDPAVVLREE